MSALINAKTNVKIHNRFVIEKFNSEMELLETAYAENVVLNRFWNRFFSNEYIQTGHIIQIGTGTGTPAVTDTALFTPLASQTTEFISAVWEYPTSNKVIRAVFPASSSEVGMVTEVGLHFWTGGIYTHAMLQDAEGNPISINKTDVDVLIVTATQYVTFTPVAPFEPCAIAKNRIFSAFLDHNNQEVWRYVRATFTLSNPANNITGGHLGVTKTPTFIPAERTVNFTTTREPSNSALNGEMLNYLNIVGVGFVSLPNFDVFPPYETAFTLVGHGDGITTEFVCPIPVFIEETETLNIGNTTLTRNVDYTIEAQGNTALCQSAAISCRSIILAGIRVTSTDNSFYTPCMKHGGGTDSIYGEELTTGGYSFTNAQPIVYDLQEAKPVNTLYLERLASYSSFSRTGQVFFDYSFDNENWTNVVEIASTTYSSKGNGTGGTMPAGGPQFSFTEVTARYWRLRFVGEDGNLVAPLAAKTFFGHVGQKIKFTTPPAVDTVIAIKAQVDRPWKTADYVVDFSVSLTL